MDEAIDFHLHRQPHLSPRSRLFVLGSMQERCTRFEAVFMRLTLHMGRTMAVPEGATPANQAPRFLARSNGSPCWEQSGFVDLSECLLRLVPF